MEATGTKTSMSNLDNVRDDLNDIVKTLISTTKDLDSANDGISEIKHTLKNGFKQDIKDHITKTNEDLKDDIQELTAAVGKLTGKIEKLVDNLTSPYFWLQIIAGLVIAIGAISAVVLKMFN